MPHLRRLSLEARIVGAEGVLDGVRKLQMNTFLASSLVCMNCAWNAFSVQISSKFRRARLISSRAP
jgi:hypothetical protein